MHCPNFNVSGMQKPFSSSRPNISIELEDKEDGLDNVFTTLDQVRGNVLVSVARQTELEKIDIIFEGLSSTSTSRSISYVPGRRRASHPFLCLRQPTNSSEYTDQKLLLPGKTYNFPFEFVIPEKLLPQCCNHETNSKTVQQAHTQLPPSLSNGSTAFWQPEEDGMTPKTCRVSYAVRATIFERPCDSTTPSELLCDISKPVRVVPSVAPKKRPEDCPVYCLFKQINTPSGLTRQKAGQMQVAAEQPKPIRILSLGAGSTKTSTTAIELHLRFDPAANEPPPRFHHVRSKLKAITHYCTIPGKDLPSPGEVESYETDREAYFTAISLSSQNVSSLEWAKLPSFDSVVGKGIDDGSEYASDSDSTISTLVDSPSQGCYTTSITAPVTLPSVKSLVPTFHSCLVSRSYLVELTLSYSMAHSVCSSSASLRVPVDVIYSG